MSYSVKLKKIHIRNFRSIVDEIIDVEQFNMFVGLNDSGKSNVLKALNLFFNGETEHKRPFNFEKDFCQKGKIGQGKAREIIVELELEVPDNFSEKGVKTWRKVWRREGLVANNLTSLFKEYSKCVTLFNRIIFEYVPAVKSDEIFKDLLVKLYNSMTYTANSALSSLTADYSNAIKGLTINLTHNVKRQVGLDSIVQMPDDLGVLFRDMRISTKDAFVRNIDLDYRGDGIKARHIPSILLSIANNIKQNREKNTVEHTFIWGYEEPENGVEFSASIKLAEELYNYSKDYQVLLTTHSPAFYSIRERSNIKPYYVYKDNSGCSKYEENRDAFDINEKIGLLPLITPYIEKALNDLEQNQKEKDTLEKEVEKLKAVGDKTIIFTEGKTDEIILNKAIEKLGISDLNVEIHPINMQSNQKGNESICALLNNLRCNNVNNNLVIGLFDRDVKQKVSDGANMHALNEVEYVKMCDNVYAFALPVPHDREETDQISIEHYFKDDEITRFNKNGQRLFLGSEFNATGNHITDNYHYHYIEKFCGTIKIIEHETKNYVTDKDGNGDFSLSKMRFAEAIRDEIENFNDFDFSEFNKIFVIIRKIMANQKGE